MENNNNTPPPYELKLEHQLEHQPEATDFTVDVNAKFLRQGSTSPSEYVFFSSTVHNFIWEDEDCPGKVEFYEYLVDVGIDVYEAQFLLNDMILYVCEKTPSLDEEYKGVFTLTVEVTLPQPEAVEINQAGSEQTQSQEPIATTKTTSEQYWIRRLKPRHKIQKTQYKIGPNGVSLVLATTTD